jgi:Fe(3+) dicitrate transport protein
VVSEDLFGLKVNISVRGLTPRRSARTLLLEDGMPIQLALGEL